MADRRAGLLVIARPCLRTIREHAEAAWPHEACGLLEGHAAGRFLRVRRVIACRNEHEDPAHRYRIDPETFLRAERAAERVERRVVGVWHSHPHGEAYLSDTDRAEAWPGWSYLVAGVTNGSMQALRAWFIDDEPLEQRLRLD
ncbi:MAG: M67 family metallopeptidase [Halofilum sp. (in: g-proteobacteria)]|nr:M67 family metallopeptidase [Halofilum sp. (in: g-proteobacteria)]